MKHYEKLTKKRKAFIGQLYNLINTQFEEQEKLKGLSPLEMIEELENNSEYIQRIFIDAPWGMGKTFFSKALKEKIEEENEDKKENKKINLININAWETDYFSDPMKSLVGEIDGAVGLSDNIKEESKNLLSRGIQTLKKIGWNEVLRFIGDAGLNKALNKVGITEDKKKEIIKAFNETNEIDTNELEEYQKYKELITHFKITLSEDEKLKVIVIDELDRCKPTYAIELLETIKHFFGVKNIIFVFLVNKKQLQSIASTSYIQDDDCSEYFEKFFDIQFKLPNLEYEDFFEIEYNKYNDIHTYNITPYSPQYSFTNNIRIDYVADDVNSFYEVIFLETFKSNCDSSVVSLRNLIKSFKKFRLLLSSLSLKEKGCYPLMIVLVLYFVREEFLTKNNTDNNFKILDLYSKTFFNQNLLKVIEKNLANSNDLEDNFYKYFSVKKSFYNFQEFYKIFYFTLYYSKDKEKLEKNYSNTKDFSIYLFDNVKLLTKEIILTINEKNIINKNIHYYLYISQFNKRYFYLDTIFFINLDVQNYLLEENNISSTILEAWAKDKYEFILFQQEKENI